jgi:hypothetical protein
MPKQNERKKTINKVSNTLQIKHEPNFFFLKKLPFSPTKLSIIKTMKLKKKKTKSMQLNLSLYILSAWPNNLRPDFSL